jgi:hypothetical protein
MGTELPEGRLSAERKLDQWLGEDREPVHAVHQFSGEHSGRQSWCGPENLATADVRAGVSARASASDVTAAHAICTGACALGGLDWFVKCNA